MKKVVVFLLVLIMAVGLVACSNKKEENEEQVIFDETNTIEEVLQAIKNTTSLTSDLYSEHDSWTELNRTCSQINNSYTERFENDKLQRYEGNLFVGNREYILFHDYVGGGISIEYDDHTYVDRDYIKIAVDNISHLLSLDFWTYEIQKNQLTLKKNNSSIKYVYHSFNTTTMYIPSELLILIPTAKEYEPIT